MTRAAGASGIEVVLLDIEGTTTPITFVTRVLFPYARMHLRSYLEEQAGSAEHETLMARLRAEQAARGHDGNDIASYVEWLMDRDEKSAPLKDLQGRIWEGGYQRGELVGDVFSDVPPALARWTQAGQRVAIFSSGSVLAQRLLFRHTAHGDLAGFIDGYFDTRVGKKNEAESYGRIARDLGVAPRGVMFLSDVPRELDAARAAEMQVRLVVRPGNAPASDGQDYERVESFDEL